MYQKKNYSYDQLKNKALYFINYRLRTKKQVIEKLKKLNASQEDIFNLVNELEEIGLINDEKFIDLFVREYFEVKKLGVSRILIELKHAGFSNELIQDAINQYTSFEEYDPTQEATFLIKNKYSNLSTPKEDHKIIAFLIRKGFSYSIAQQALQRYKKDS